MKKKLFAVVLSLCLLASHVPPALAEAGEGTPPESWRAVYENVSQVAEGLTYTDTVFETGDGGRVESFCLEADGAVRPIVATGECLHEAMTPEEVCALYRARGLNVLGAVNADFYYSSVDLPIGGVVMDGAYISSVEAENLLAITDEGAFFSEKPSVELTLVNNGGGESPDGGSNAGKSVRVDHLNKIRVNNGGLYLYTTAYHPDRTVTTRLGWAVRFRVLSGTLTVSGAVELEVVEVIPQCRDIEIGQGYMVLTCPLDGPYPETYRDFSVGDRVTLNAAASDERLSRARWATGCGDLLVSGGEITDSTGWDEAISQTRHPRTAFGVRADGTAVALVIDGRQGDRSEGATLLELARRMKALGCEFAVNLDGGGSSAMVLSRPGEEECVPVNHPSDGRTRELPTYILFVSDEVPDGVADRAHIGEDGGFVLAGSSTVLTPLATDAGRPVDMPEGVTMAAEKGTIAGGVYTAGTEAGTDTVTLLAPDGTVLGTGTLHVTDRLEGLTVTDRATGRAPKLTDLALGSEIGLTVTGRYLGREISLEGVPVTFAVSEGIGRITQEGVYTAEGVTRDEGTVTVAALGVSVELPVRLKVRYYDIQGHWAEGYIGHLYDKGVLKRTEDGLIHPDGAVERWEFAMMLWRAVGSPRLSGECRFTDVPRDSEYYRAVLWGQLIGLIYGTDTDKFDPEGPVTREQAFTLVYRLLTIFRKELPEADETALAVFPDAGEVSEYALEAVCTLVRAGIVGGSEGLLMPRSVITRAELAKITCQAVLNWTPSGG